MEGYIQALVGMHLSGSVWDKSALLALCPSCVPAEDERSAECLLHVFIYPLPSICSLLCGLAGSWFPPTSWGGGAGFKGMYFRRLCGNSGVTAKLQHGCMALSISGYA